MYVKVGYMFIFIRVFYLIFIREDKIKMKLSLSKKINCIKITRLLELMKLYY